MCNRLGIFNSFLTKLVFTGEDIVKFRSTWRKNACTETYCYSQVIVTAYPVSLQPGLPLYKEWGPEHCSTVLLPATKQRSSIPNAALVSRGLNTINRTPNSATAHHKRDHSTAAFGSIHRPATFACYSVLKS